MILGKSRAGYVLVFERTRTGYSAHIPDVLGCIATGRTLEGTERLLESGVRMHFRALLKDGLRFR